jgi:hypothetical protein
MKKGQERQKKKLYIKNIASFEVFVVAVCGTISAHKNSIREHLNKLSVNCAKFGSQSHQKVLTTN